MTHIQQLTAVIYHMALYGNKLGYLREFPPVQIIRQ